MLFEPNQLTWKPSPVELKRNNPVSFSFSFVSSNLCTISEDRICYAQLMLMRCFLVHFRLLLQNIRLMSRAGWTQFSLYPSMGQCESTPWIGWDNPNIPKQWFSGPSYSTLSPRCKSSSSTIISPGSSVFLQVFLMDLCCSTNQSPEAISCCKIMCSVQTLAFFMLWLQKLRLCSGKQAGNCLYPRRSLCLLA